VDESTRIIVVLILILIIMLILAFYGQTLMMKRALKMVLKILRDHEALKPESAKFVNDMGLQKKGLLQIKAFRDYKPAAIQFLVKQEIIIVTEEGKIYLSEDALRNTGIEDRLNGKKTIGMR
jgi:hypothetical protein